MSLKSWKAEFYTIEAREVAEENAAAHSLQKWIGLRQENLDKHEVFISSSLMTSVSDNKDNLGINGLSCSLCVLYHSADCDSCPLRNYLGGRCDGDERSPYGIFIDTLDPEPMISALSALCE